MGGRARTRGANRAFRLTSQDSDGPDVVPRRYVTDLLSHRLIARLAGALFITGSLVLLTVLLVPDNGWSAAGVLAVVASGVTVGVITLVLPWHRWSRSTTLVLVPIALGLITLGNVLQDDPWVYAAYYVVVFAWIGIAHPQRTSLKMMPLALASYLAPGLWIHLPSEAVQSTLVVMPVCLAVGEGLAWIAGRARQAEQADAGRMRALESLVDATSALARQNDPATAAGFVAECGAKMLGAKSAVVLLIDARGGVRGAGAYKWPTPPADLHARWLDQPARDALAAGEVTRHSGSPLVGDLTHAAGGAPVVFVPLGGSTQPVGLLMATFESERESRVDRFAANLLGTFGTQAGLAFERLSATEKLVEASLRDALTGIGNRRQADQSLALVGHDDAVAILDLDHFKDVNDKYGHGVGDTVLRDLARFLEQRLREGDSVARYGGEEFLVILKRVGDQASTAFERLAEEWRASSPLATFSVGVAVHERGAPAKTLSRADAALYQAKAEGRDRVILASAAVSEVG